MYDEENSVDEDQYDTIGDISIGYTKKRARILPVAIGRILTQKSLKGDSTMENTIGRNEIKKVSLEFSTKEMEELERARKMPITFDDDCPETTPERARKFKWVNPPRKA